VEIGNGKEVGLIVRSTVLSLEWKLYRDIIDTTWNTYSRTCTAT